MLIFFILLEIAKWYYLNAIVLSSLISCNVLKQNKQTFPHQLFSLQTMERQGLYANLKWETLKVYEGLLAEMESNYGKWSTATKTLK